MKSDNRPRIYYGYIVVAVACLILIITQGTYFSFGVFFKPLSGDFGWTRAMTSGAFSLCSILSGLFVLLTGRLNDRIGPRFVMTICAVILGVGYLLMSRIGALWQLYVFYGVIIAMGMSGGFTPMVSTAARWFVKRRSLMVGIVAAGTAFGTLIVPPVANQLIATYDWRESYTIVGIGAIIIIVTLAQFLRRDPSQVGQLPDGEKAAEFEAISSESPGFSLAESIRTTQFWMLLGSKICQGFCTMVIMVHIVPHATDFGISATEAANIMGVIGGGGIFGRIAMGFAGDKIGNKQAMAACIILLILGFTVLITTKAWWVFYFFAAIFGFGYGGSATLASPLVADFFGLRSHGVIMAFVSLGLRIGGSTGSVVAGRIFDVTGSYQLAFITCLILLVIALTLILLLKPTTKVAPKEGNIGYGVR